MRAHLLLLDTNPVYNKQAFSPASDFEIWKANEIRRVNKILNRLDPEMFDQYQAEERARGSRRKICIQVLKARNLVGKDPNGMSDPYVAIEYGDIIAKTTVKPATLSPVWDEKIIMYGFFVNSCAFLAIFLRFAAQ